MAKRKAPEINAGSMADIAFLLLIFFLVTTTIESDKGISRRLPPIDENNQSESIHKERNVMEVIMDKQGNLLVRDKPMKIGELRQAAIDFIDNGAGTGSNACSYCMGPKKEEASENPNKALISIEYDRQTKYEKYIAVQNEIMAAFNELRNRVAQSKFGTDYTKMVEEMNKASDDVTKNKIKDKIKEVRKFYPLNITEVKPEKV